MASETFDMLDTSPRQSSRAKWIGLGILGALLLGVVLFFLMRDRSQQSTPDAGSASAGANVEQPASTIAPAPAESTTVSMPARVAPQPVDETVHFAHDRSEVSPSDLSRLETFWTTVKDHEGEIIIGGHADATGAEDYNQQLSTRRAETVAATLNNLGMAGKQKVNLQAFGETKPVDDKNTEEARQKNRRAEIAFKPR